MLWARMREAPAAWAACTRWRVPSLRRRSLSSKSRAIWRGLMRRGSAVSSWMTASGRAWATAPRTASASSASAIAGSAPDVLQLDDVRALDQLGRVEVRGQRLEERVGHVDRSAAHGDRVVQHELLELVEAVACAVARQGQQLLLADARTVRDPRADVDAVLALRERCGLQFSKHLQPLGHAVQLRG